MTLLNKTNFANIIALSTLIVGGFALLAWLCQQKVRKKRVELRSLKNMTVHLVNKPEEWESLFPVLQQEMNQVKVIGIDCEWVLKSKVALLQISTQTGLCILVRLCHLTSNIPPSFRSLLSDKRILKVGVAVRDDARRLLRDHNLPVLGCVDLRHVMHRVQGVYTCHSWGLQGLAKTVLGVDLSKDPAIRCGNWEALHLSAQQVEYAAIDSTVAIDIFTHLVLAKVLGKDPRLHDKEAQSVAWQKFWISARSLCQGIVDVGYSCDHGTSQLKRHKKQEIQRSKSYSSRQRPLWDNCKLLAPDGQLLCTCDNRKAIWYILKELGDKVSDDPLTVKLRFEPSSRPKSDRNYYLQTKENVCVVCGASESYIRKFVVPQEYRKYFPSVLKEHTSHDVLLMCPSCHQHSSEHDGAMRFQLAKECDAPLDSGQNSRTTQDYDLQQVRSAARALKANSRTIPHTRARQLEEIVLNFYGVQSISDDLLEKAAELNTKQTKRNFVSHGQQVVEYMLKHHGLLEFQARWRQHFVSTMQPKFLPTFWSVDYVPENWVDSVFGERTNKSEQRLEMNGGDTEKDEYGDEELKDKDDGEIEDEEADEENQIEENED